MTALISKEVGFRQIFMTISEVTPNICGKSCQKSLAISVTLCSTLLSFCQICVTITSVCTFSRMLHEQWPKFGLIIQGQNNLQLPPFKGTRHRIGIAQLPWRPAAASASKSIVRAPLISFWIPEWPLQTNPCKNLDHLVWSRPARLNSQAMLIPGHRQIP